MSTVDADQSFRGLDAVDRDTAWVSGASVSGDDARVYLTQDGGDSWQDVSPAGSAGLNFRDVEAEDTRTASVLAIGEGEASRIYRTTDGGATWSETFRNTEPTAFYNCMDFYPGGKRGLAASDPVDGKFRIISTQDGGRSWEVLPDAGMPNSTGEANFSASGDCLTISGRDSWFGSGGAKSRVFHSTDRGLTWTATGSAIPAGEAAGVFGLAFKNPRQGVAVGGDFAAAADGVDASATTRDGKSWRAEASSPTSVRTRHTSAVCLSSSARADRSAAAACPRTAGGRGSSSARSGSTRSTAPTTVPAGPPVGAAASGCSRAPEGEHPAHVSLGMRLASCFGTALVICPEVSVPKHNASRSSTPVTTTPPEPLKQEHPNENS